MIRASMLPGALDCGRRAAARQWPDLIISKGYTLAQTMPSAGARLGDAVHLAAAELLRSRMFENIIAPETVMRAIEKAWAEFLRAIKKGVTWDKTTKNTNDALRQLEAMVFSLVAIIQRMLPAEIERKLEYGHYTGQLDVLESTGVLTDFKTGAKEPSPWAQLGLYAMLCESAGLSVNQTQLIYTPRLSVNTPQPEPIIRVLDAEEAKRAAFNIVSSLETWKARFEISGDSWEFPANPMSMMCTPVYCGAYGGPFCKVGKPRGGN